MSACVDCGSWAINHHLYGRDGTRPDLCDTCYWRSKAEEMRMDAERLDALENLLNEQRDGMLLLHHGAGAGRGIVGLGLRNTNRTLRQAIDSARGAIDAARKEGV